MTFWFLVSTLNNFNNNLIKITFLIFLFTQCNFRVCVCSVNLNTSIKGLDILFTISEKEIIFWIWKFQKKRLFSETTVTKTKSLNFVFVIVVDDRLFIFVCLFVFYLDILHRYLSVWKKCSWRNNLEKFRPSDFFVSSSGDFNVL